MWLIRVIIWDIHGKFLQERNQMEEKREALESKMDFIVTNEEKDISYQEVKEKTENFLKPDYINKEILFDIVNRIEIDENKKVYIYFNFGVEGENNVSIS